MAKPNKRQARADPKIKCEYSGCMVTFGRNSDRLRHVREKHGPLIYCRIPGCKYTTRRMGRLRAHLDIVHRSEVSTNRIPSEFRTATAQSLAFSSNHFSSPDANIDFNFIPTPPLIYIDYTFGSQAHQSQPDASESYTILNQEETLHFENNPTSGSSAALKPRAQVPPYRVYRPCRVRRRAPCTNTRISSVGPPLTHVGSAMESPLHLYSNEQDGSTASMQWMLQSFNAELMATLISSLNLGYSIN